MDKIEEIKKILEKNFDACLEARDYNDVYGVMAPIWKERDFDGHECFLEVKRYFNVMQEISNIVNV